MITIDGPAGTGKTTVAKGVSEKLGLAYFDTGAMYRAVAHLLLTQDIPLSDEERIKALLATFDFRMEKGRYFVGTEDVTEPIRSQAVNQIVSQVAALSFVREALWAIQRHFAKKHGGVFEGRDIGSVVFPKAKYKIYLTARPEVRAERRLAEMRLKNPSLSLTPEEMLSQLQKRDELDSTRELAPLICPPDAYVIDTSSLTIDEVIDRIAEYRQKKIGRPSFLQNVPLLYRLVLLFSWIFGKLFYHFKIYGLEHYYPRGAIIAANHTSFFDPPIVSVSWPEEVHFLARETLFKNPLFGALIRHLNSHPVARGSLDLGAIKTICALLEAGKKVVLFPEGTRSPDGQLQPLKAGIATLITRTSTAVIPCYIDGAFEAWGRHRKWPRLCGRVSCVFGSPITAESFSHLEKKEAQAQISAALEKAILQLKDWLKSGAEGIPP